MATKIDKKIIGYKVINETSKMEAIETASQEVKPDILHEAIERPEMLVGSTYKIKTPQSEHALYITINDIILNQGTDHEEHRPYEVFINSKNMEHFQWVLALTRVISACFRKGGDICFLVEELKAVFDPKGGYFKKGGVYMPSLVAEIGGAIESHMKQIGMLEVEEMDDHRKRFLAAKRKEFEAEQEKLEKERAKEFVEAKNKGGDTTEIVKAMAVKETFVPVGVEEKVGGVTSRAIKVWEVYLLDGSKWDKKKRLPVRDVIELGVAGADYHLMAVDAVAINNAFNSKQPLPSWVKVEDSRRIRG